MQFLGGADNIVWEGSGWVGGYLGGICIIYKAKPQKEPRVEDLIKAIVLIRNHI